MNMQEQTELRNVVICIANINAPSDVDTHIINSHDVLSRLSHNYREAIEFFIAIFHSCDFNNDGSMNRRYQAAFENAGVKVNGPRYHYDSSGVIYHLEIATSEDKCLPDSYGHHIIEIEIIF